MKARLLAPLTIALLIFPVFASASSCPNLTRNLSLGLRGADIVQLQDFLIERNFLGQGNNSGYFGRLTKASVIQFQSGQGLPSTGLVGPLTRTIIERFCGAGVISKGFSASPLAGNAPLIVNFMYQQGPGTFTIEYGDGTSAEMVPTDSPCPPNAKCAPYFGSSHTYATAGTYNIQLKAPDPTSCVQLQSYPPRISCGASTIIASATITVRASGAGSGLYGKITKTTGNCMPMVYEPNMPDTPRANPCGTFPVSTEVYAYPVFSNTTYIEAYPWSGAGTYYSFLVTPVLGEQLYKAPLTLHFSTSNHEGGSIIFGDGGQVTCAATGSYPGPCNNGITHTYTAPGTYTAKLLGPTGDIAQQAQIRVLDGGVTLIAKTTSDTAGNYTLLLPPARYSIFVKDNGTPGCGAMNADGLCAIEVKTGAMTLNNININAAVW